LIKLEHVGKTYTDGTEAVKDLTMEIKQGEFCVFLGPSGCGKTTSMKMINRLIPLTTGKIYVDGVDFSATLTFPEDSYGTNDVTARIASRHGWTNVGWGSYAGNLDEFAYWNRALSATEVQTIWDAAGGGGGEIVLGDVNLDGIVNGLDVDPFVDVLLNGPFQDEADMNADGEVNGLDVDPFVAAVVGGGVQAVPEPSTLVLCGLVLMLCVVLRGRPAQA